MGTIFEQSHDVEARALRCASGSYQIALLRGSQEWSGADLRGKARHWGASYDRSRSSLLARMEHYATGLSVAFLYLRCGGRKIAVIIDASSNADPEALARADGYVLRGDRNLEAEERKRSYRREWARRARAARSDVQRRAESLRRRLARGVRPDPGIVLGECVEGSV